MATAATTIAANAMGVVTGLSVDSRHTQLLDWEAKSSAAILDLVKRILAADDVEAGCHILARQLCDYFGCQQVALGLKSSKESPCRLVTVSGVARIDRATELSQAFEAAFAETLMREAVTIWPVTADGQRHCTAAHRALANLTRAATIVSVPLRGPGGEVVSCCTLLGTPELARDENIRFLAAAAPTVGSSLATLGRAQLPRPWQAVQRLRAKLGSRRKVVIAAVASITAVLCLPLPYKVSCQCELQPVVRRYVAAPYAGLFAKSLVKPGDLVAKDQVLGRMDGREIRWELAGLAAEESRAGKACDVNLAGSKVAAAQIDKLEMERLELKRRLLASREANLDIKSPIDGMVISGDLQRSEGVPLAVGQLLYEIAPLDRMVAELAIDDQDIAYVEAGQDVSIRLDAYPGQAWTGKLHLIHPRSQVRETDNVFIAELLLDNEHHALRPGMKGSSKIQSDRHTLAWILFHKPYRRVASWFGW